MLDIQFRGVYFLNTMTADLNSRQTEMLGQSEERNYES
jgi:hypothetical protein